MAYSLDLPQKRMRFLKLPLICSLLIVYASCKKDSGSVDLTPSFYFFNGDTSAFANTLVLFSSSDTATVNVIVSSTYVLSKPADVTLAVADTARSSYNSYHATAYQPMPANAYSFSTTYTDTSISTSANPSVYDTIPVKIFKNQLNPAVSYMLPIKIVTAGSYNITLGSSVIYLHTISSKLAGIYTSKILKTLYVGDSADNNISGTDTFTITKNIVPGSLATQFNLDYADLGGNGWQYILSFFTDVPSEPPVFTATPNAIILNSVQSGSFKIMNAAYNSANNNIYIKSSYKNLSGDERIVEENLSLQ